MSSSVSHPELPRARAALGTSNPRRERTAPVEREVLCHEARSLLETRFGTAEATPAVGFARGAVGLLSEQTHYSDGFGVLMPLPLGAAVAVRPTPESRSRMTVAYEDTIWTATEAASEARPLQARVVAAAMRAFAPRPVEVAVVSSVPPACFDASLAALGTAAARALCNRSGIDPASKAAPEGDGENEHVPALLKDVRQLLAETSGRPFSIAYPLAATTGRPPDFTLVDTATGEHLPVETPPLDTLGRALVMLPSTDPDRAATFHRKRRQQAHEALAQLREGGFETLDAFRDLEHRDLDRALALLPPTLRPIARHLVTENGRVPKLVAAARRGDGQLLGALLLMSHTSLRDDWQSTSPALDLIAETVEAGTSDGVYGARMTGRGACALLLGRPGSLPAFLDRTAEALAERLDLHAETMLL